MKAIVILVLAIVPLSINAQESTSPIYQKGGGFKSDTVILYKEIAAIPLYLNIFYPDDFKKGEKRPTIVFYFGGGWKGVNIYQFFPQSEYLASRGMIAICAQYRTQRVGAEPYTCVEDAKSAIRYVRKNASQLGVDPNLLAAGGGSAGGHLAAATATIKAYDAESDDLSISAIPDALVLFNPVYDNGPNGYGYDRVKEYYKDISPLHNLDGKVPPTLVFMGSSDKHTPVSTTKLYEERMIANGNICETTIYEGQKHGFFNLHKATTGKYFIDTVEKMDRFLSDLGFLEGEPTIKEWFAEQE